MLVPQHDTQYPLFPHYQDFQNEHDRSRLQWIHVTPYRLTYESQSRTLLIALSLMSNIYRVNGKHDCVSERRLMYILCTKSLTKKGEVETIQSICCQLRMAYWISCLCLRYAYCSQITVISVTGHCSKQVLPPPLVVRYVHLVYTNKLISLMTGIVMYTVHALL